MAFVLVLAQAQARRHRCRPRPAAGSLPLSLSAHGAALMPAAMIAISVRAPASAGSCGREAVAAAGTFRPRRRAKGVLVLVSTLVGKVR